MNAKEYISLYGLEECIKYNRCATPKEIMDTAVICDVCGRKIIEPSVVMNAATVNYLCKIKKDEVVVSPVVHHHTSYEEDVVMLVCNKCHAKIHFRKKCKYKPLDPRPDPKYKIVACSICGGGARVNFDELADGKALCYRCKNKVDVREKVAIAMSRRVMIENWGCGSERDFISASELDDLSEFYKRM